MTLAVNSEQREDNAYLVWDTYEVAKAQAEHLQEEDPDLSDDDAYEQASADEYLYECEWDYLLTCLTDKMEEVNPGGQWRCEGSGLGWQKRSGWMEFSATNGRDFLQAILPRTECTFKIYLDGEGDDQEIRMVNSHHDAMGEVYIIRPQAEEEEDE